MPCVYQQLTGRLPGRFERDVSDHQRSACAKACPTNKEAKELLKDASKALNWLLFVYFQMDRRPGGVQLRTEVCVR